MDSLEQATAYKNQGDYEKAAIYFGQAGAWANAADCYMQAGKMKDAAIAWRKAAKSTPGGMMERKFLKNAEECEARTKTPSAEERKSQAEQIKVAKNRLTDLDKKTQENLDDILAIFAALENGRNNHFDDALRQIGELKLKIVHNTSYVAQLIYVAPRLFDNDSQRNQFIDNCNNVQAGIAEKIRQVDRIFARIEALKKAKR